MGWYGYTFEQEKLELGFKNSILILASLTVKSCLELSILFWLRNDSIVYLRRVCVPDISKNGY